MSGQSGGAVVAVIHPASGDGRFSTYPPSGLDGANYCQLYMNQAIDAGTVYQDLGSAYQYQAGLLYRSEFGDWLSVCSFSQSNKAALLQLP